MGAIDTFVFDTSKPISTRQWALLLDLYDLYYTAITPINLLEGTLGTINKNDVQYLVNSEANRLNATYNRNTHFSYDKGWHIGQKYGADIEPYGYCFNFRNPREDNWLGKYVTQATLVGIVDIEIGPSTAEKTTQIYITFHCCDYASDRFVISRDQRTGVKATYVQRMENCYADGFVKSGQYNNNVQESINLPTLDSATVRLRFVFAYPLGQNQTYAQVACFANNVSASVTKAGVGYWQSNMQDFSWKTVNACLGVYLVGEGNELYFEAAAREPVSKITQLRVSMGLAKFYSIF